MLGSVDAAFLAVVAFPGHVDGIGGLPGPVICCLAAASTVAQRTSPLRAG